MQKFSGSEESFYWALEMMNTGALRAAIISNGNNYPPSTIDTDDNIIIKTAFKMKWVELHGEKNYEEHNKKYSGTYDHFEKNNHSNLIFIHQTNDIFKILYGYFALIILALLPVLISVIGGYIGNAFGYELNESNSIIGSIGWFSLLTIPLCLFIAILWTGLAIWNLLNFYKKN